MPGRFAAAAALALALVAASCGRDLPAPSSTACGGGPVSVGERLPDCAFEGLAGGSDVSLAALGGKPAVINFWASWCVNCKEEMPAFERVHRTIGDRVRFVGLDFLGGFNVERRPAAEALARSTGVTYALAYDPDGAFYGRFCACPVRPLMPLTVFADERGVVRERHFGPFDERQLRRRIRSLFGIA